MIYTECQPNNHCYTNSPIGENMDEDNWNERYRSGSYTPRDYPSEVLREYSDWLPDGQALDIATGVGRNALYLAKEGYEVDAVDFSNEALGVARERAETQQVHVNWVKADLETEGPPEGEYDVIVVSFYKSYELLCELKERLAPGGVLIYEHHLKSADPVDRGSTNDRHRYGSNDLLRCCLDLTILRYTEGKRFFQSGERAGQTAAVVTLIARNSTGGKQSYPPE